LSAYLCDTASSKCAGYLISAWGSENELVLGELAVEEREITKIECKP